ncbi:hypothetical protein Ngar_c00490 [Candidatus Nitrososphaera gargensis Ga9.2]|uniref:Uncharacterized protein n=1 Tax=Nitrososphaera gargensis (strain Ga9.2) TaxID=1237085 RepID=K0ILC4_NITGG|nr:hypothetical protein Ngar_c00490 [Candidatus Nitrososphaera gargensis Ga9.2]
MPLHFLAKAPYSWIMLAIVPWSCEPDSCPALWTMSKEFGITFILKHSFTVVAAQLYHTIFKGI